jgi:hypothetical protein
MGKGAAQQSFVIMWGLQNESKLPEDFAKECTALIRQLRSHNFFTKVGEHL